MDVSIIIPYNIDRGYLKDAINSCMNQTFNGSFEVLPIYGKDKSVGENINDGLKVAKGEFIKLCAEDDLLLPDCLQVLYDEAVKNNLDFVCANAINRGAEKEYIVESFIPYNVSQLAKHNTIHGLTILYRKCYLPLFYPNLKTAEEYYISLQMAEAGLKFGHVNHTVGVYRLHESQKSGVYVGGEIDRIAERRKLIYDLIQSEYINSEIIINQ